MADEPRRSVRATKGQHTKSLDILDQPEPKKKATKKSKKAAQQEEEEEVEIIRCVCGAIETGDDEGEPWIACDKCTVWQHNVCVGVSPYSEDTPENYLCEQCGPEFHKPLLDAIKRGENLWIQRRLAYEREKAEEENEGPKKKGKKAKGKHTNDIKLEAPKSTNGKAESPSVPVETPHKKEPVAKAGSAKRKTRDESYDKDPVKEPQSKMRKVSTAPPPPTPKSPPSGLPVKIIDLESTRQGFVKFLHKTLVQTISTAIKTGVYVLNANDTVDAKSERLSIEIEDAIYKTHPDKNAFGKQSRTISANLKQNQELTNGLLKRSLSPQVLAVMTSDDMASNELKRETAEMKARADKQSIMITDDGPRVRRTHKGDEVVEGDSFAVANDSTMSTSRRRSMLDPNSEMAIRSRENSPGQEVELPENIDDYRSRDDIRGNAVPKQPLSVETKPSQEPSRKASGTNFDIAKVFSSVQSPTSSQHIRRASSNITPQVKSTGVDPDIDRLLQDDEGNESPPYSPAEYDSDPEIIWRGTVTMDSIAKFPAVAKYAAGADLSPRFPWSDLLEKELKIAGRIDTEKANEYLCSLRYSPQTDVTVVAVTPTGETAGQGYNAMFNYFNSKSRYGVLANKGTGNIRDTYLVPVPASPANLPDFIINLEGHKVPESRPEPLILIALVIRNDWQVPPQLDGSIDAQTPVMGHPQRQMSISGTGPAMSPINLQGSFPPTPSPQIPMHISAEEAQRRQAAEDQRNVAQQEGEANAARILGHHVKASTVAFLMPQAFQMRTVEWQIIRDILEKDVKARDDLQHLSQVLEVRMAQEGQIQAAQSQAQV